MNHLYYYNTKTPFKSDNQKITDVKLHINCAGTVDDENFFSNKSVRRDFYFIYLLKGKLVTVSGELMPGDFILYKPNTPYRYESCGYTSYLFVHFSGSEADKTVAEIGLPTGKSVHIGVHTSLKERFENLFREFMILDSESNEIMTHILQEILILTARYIKGGSLQKPPLKSLQYIHLHYTENITVEELSEIEEMSLTKYRTVFKKHTGQSPLDYIISLRTNAACRLLTTSHASVAEIASKTGYADQYYFSRIFKKKTGVSPLEYRKKETM